MHWQECVEAKYKSMTFALCELIWTTQLPKDLIFGKVLVLSRKSSLIIFERSGRKVETPLSHKSQM